MKRKILAAILAVAMVFGICTIASADDSKWTAKEWWGGAGEKNEVKIAEVAGADGQQTHVLSIQNNAYSTGNFGTICSGLDTTKTYKFSAKINYDIAHIGLHDPNNGNAALASLDNLLGNEWKTVEAEFTGATDVLMAVQIQATYGWNNETGYIDDITITDPDGNVVFSEDFEPKEENPAEVPTATATTEVDNKGAVLFEEDFEDQETNITVVGNGTDFNQDTIKEGEEDKDDARTSYGIVTDIDDPSNNVFNIHDSTWGQFNTNNFVEGLDAKKEYTMKLSIMGDTGWFGIMGQTTAIVGCNEAKQYLFSDGLLSEWKTYVFKFTGVTGIAFGGQVQAEYGYKNANIYLDDITVYVGDVVEQLSATPEPTAEATTAPTATPSVTPSITPTTEPTTKPTKKPVKSVKFTKKSVKIKKGKKVTLKVTIKGAKKATFSVDKKGKKVVKLSKAKAKSVVVTGKKKGKATITAKAAGKKATCKVTVKK